MSASVRKLTIRGFKSIKSLEDFELRDLNVLIGANGAGKSNFVEFFGLLRELVNQRLQAYVALRGGADAFCHLGPKVTPLIQTRIEFKANVYECDWRSTVDGQLMFNAERTQFTGGGKMYIIGHGHFESRLADLKDEPGAFHGKGPSVEKHTYDAIAAWQVYHFHDTGILAPIRRVQSARDFDRLNGDGGNIAAFLLKLREAHPTQYSIIRDSIRLIAPFFDDFLLRPKDQGGVDQIRLEWKQRGSDFPFQTIHFSDGTLRFICLATALLQPRPPATIVIDEPELGLHPFALAVLADLIHSASTRTQLIVSTQSPTLLDHFRPEEIIVVRREEGHSTFERLDHQSLADWLRDYTVGELWQKNVVRGGPEND